MGNFGCKNCLDSSQQHLIQIEDQPPIQENNKVVLTQQSNNQIDEYEVQKDETPLISENDVKYNKDQRKFTKALEKYEQFLLLQQKNGKVTIQTACVRHKIGRLYYNQGNYAKALEQYILSLQLKQTLKGKGCYQTASTLNNIGLIYAHQGNQAKALQYYTLSLKIYERKKGMGCFESAVTIHNIGTVFNNQLEYSKSLEYYEQALEIYEHFGIKAKGYIDTLQSLGNTYFHMKNYSSAIKSYESCLQVECKARSLKQIKIVAFKLLQCLKIMEKTDKIAEVATKYGINFLSI